MPYPFVHNTARIRETLINPCRRKNGLHMRNSLLGIGSLLTTILCLALGGLFSAEPAMAKDIFVTNPMPADNTDNDVGNRTCTLRDAIFAADGLVPHNGCPAGDGNNDTIHLPSGTYTLTTALPQIGPRITIVGSGYARTTINGNRQSGLFLYADSVTLQDLTLSNFAGSALTVPGGASIYVNGVSFSNNGDSFAEGSAIHNYGVTEVYQCAFQSTAGAFSGIIRNETTGTFYMSNSTVSGSQAEHGIIYNTGGYLGIDNSTIGGNSEIASGVIHNDSGGVLNITFSTIAFNKSTFNASGIDSRGATTTVQASLVYGNGISTNPTCQTGVTSNGDNVFDSGSPCAPLAINDATTVSPNVDTSGPPAFLPVAHGGVAPVYLPNTGSPLIGHVTGFCELNDERGGGRSSFGGCAAGAVDTASVVVVVGNPLSLTMGDRTIVAQLQIVFGYNQVTVANDYWNGSPSGSAVVVTGSVNTNHIGTRLVGMNTPFVILKRQLFNVMNMTNGSGTTNAMNLRVNGPIPSSAGFTSGGYQSGNDPTFASSLQPYAWGTVDATMPEVDGMMTSNPGHAAVFRYFAYAQMFNSSYAPAARIGFFATDGVAAALNPAGDRLLQEAVLAATQLF